MDDSARTLAITGIIYRANDPYEYLLVRHKEHSGLLEQWTIPGGSLSIEDFIHQPSTDIADYFSGHIERLIRQHVTDTLHIAVSDIEYLYDPSEPYGHEALSVLSYYARYTSGSPELSHDLEASWATIEDLPHYTEDEDITKELVLVDQILHTKAKLEALERESSS